MAVSEDISCIIFDFDGTLSDLNIDWVKLRDDLNFTDDSFSVNTSRLSESERTNVFDRIEAVELAVAMPLSEKIIKMLEKLSDSYDLVIFSRNSEAAIRKSISVYEGHRYIKIIGRNRKNDKPDTKRLERYLIKKSLSPRSIIVIGDTFHDVEVAKNIGCKCIIVNNPNNLYIPKGADYYINQLEEVYTIVNGGMK
jgi:HAD superfamily hydrolase (TIGR01549 family)